jgi:DNA-binding response OmpR family regulator
MRPSIPLILLASADDVFAHSLEAAMAAAGYAVLRAATGWSAFEQQRRAYPDALVIATELDENGGVELCRALRQHEMPSRSTPIFLTQTTPTTRSQRLEALRAGADQLWGHPLDVEEFVLRLAAQLRTKFDADKARDESLIETRTRLWNHRGLLRRAEEVVAAAARDHSPVAVAVVDIHGAEQGADWNLGDRLATGLRRCARLSDTLGRLGPARCGIVAPRTGARACMRLGERLLAGIEPAVGAARSWLRVGYAAFEGASAIPAADLVAHAEAATREGATSSADGRLRCWRG